MPLPTITRDSFPALGTLTDLCALLKSPFTVYSKFLDWLDEVNAALAEVNDKTVAVGTIVGLPVNIVPDGYLKASGQAVSRTTYANLFARYGTTFGAGDGSTTFNLPNIDNKGLFGPGDNSAGTNVGSNTHTLTIAEMPAHEHTFELETDGMPNNGYNWATWEAGRESPTLPVGGETSSVGGSQAHNNIQASLVVLWVIKY